MVKILATKEDIFTAIGYNPGVQARISQLDAMKEGLAKEGLNTDGVEAKIVGLGKEFPTTKAIAAKLLKECLDAIDSTVLKPVVSKGKKAAATASAAPQDRKDAIVALLKDKTEGVEITAIQAAIKVKSRITAKVALDALVKDGKVKAKSGKPILYTIAS